MVARGWKKVYMYGFYSVRRAADTRKLGCYSQRLANV